MFQKLIQIVKKQLILLMIPHGEGRHYLAVKKLSSLLNLIRMGFLRVFFPVGGDQFDTQVIFQEELI